jgi:hypothetical protein
MRRAPLVVLALSALLASGCASTDQMMHTEQRTTHGPTAEQVWVFRIATQNGREPTFEERQHWDTQIDRQISRYLAEHPDVANSFDVSTFRHTRQVVAGMSREQVLILLGQPDAIVTDPAGMEKLASKYWPLIKGQASEAWVYPLGWRLYFSGERLVDLTQFIPRFTR